MKCGSPRVVLRRDDISHPDTMSDREGAYHRVARHHDIVMMSSEPCHDVTVCQVLFDLAVTPIKLPLTGHPTNGVVALERG